VQTLNLILLTALELDELRGVLKSSFSASASAENRDVFTKLFNCWCHNPVATLSLCLMAQAYDLASELVKKFAQVEITVGFLMQIDKLVQLIESPIFVQLRLQLLEVDSGYHPSLLKALYGLLMLLPQSAAFRTLSDRLATVSSLKQHLGSGAGRDGAASGASSLWSESERKGGAASARGGFDHAGLLRHFEHVQAKHAAARHEALLSRSLQGHPTGAQANGPPRPPAKANE
jgi:vacuole morphology and inheritance protein 14